MPNQAIQDFIDECQSTYACYTFCRSGMELHAKQFEAVAVPNATIHISDTDPNLKRPTATMNFGELIKKLKNDSEYPNTIAKFLLVYLYSRWDEYHRPLIAKSLKKEKNDILCDLMGDLREIRNEIIHNKSIIKSATIGKIKIMNWKLTSGELVVTSSMMQIFIEQTHSIESEILKRST